MKWKPPRCAFHVVESNTSNGSNGTVVWYRTGTGTFVPYMVGGGLVVVANVVAYKIYIDIPRRLTVTPLFSPLT
jgi:hypothetical protein